MKKHFISLYFRGFILMAMSLAPVEPINKKYLAHKNYA